jgi:hypothetical protein
MPFGLTWRACRLGQRLPDSRAAVKDHVGSATRTSRPMGRVLSSDAAFTHQAGTRAAVSGSKLKRAASGAVASLRDEHRRSGRAANNREQGFNGWWRIARYLTGERRGLSLSAVSEPPE